MDTDHRVDVTQRPAMLSLVWDAANLCTLLGLACSVTGIYLAGRRMALAAIVADLWAVLCDWWDGAIAERSRGRAVEFKRFGGQLDSLADLVSGGICPAAILLSVGDFRLAFLPGALALAAAGAIRLAYYNVYGLDQKAHFTGLPLVHNVPVLAVVFLAQPLLGPNVFSTVVYGVLLALCGINTSPMPFPRFPGIGIYVFTASVVVLSLVFFSRL